MSINQPRGFQLYGKKLAMLEIKLLEGRGGGVEGDSHEPPLEGSKPTMRQ